MGGGISFRRQMEGEPFQEQTYYEMKVEVVGENKYAFTFGPGAVDTIVADGTDQPAMQGTTLSVTVEGPNNWESRPQEREPHDHHGELDALGGWQNAR